MTARPGTPQHEQHRCRRVPGIVEPRVPHSCVLQERLPFTMIGSRMNRPAERVREHPSLVVPEVSGLLAFAQLVSLVLLQRRDDRCRHRDGAPPGPRLHFLRNCAPAVSLRTMPGVPVSAWVFRRAAVVPFHRLERSANGQGAGREIDVSPLQPQSFTLPKPQRHCYDEPNAIASCLARAKNSRRLVFRERNDLLLWDSWRSRDFRRVRGDVSAPHCLTQCRSDRPVHLVNSRGLQHLPVFPLLLGEFPVKRLQVFGLQLVDSVRADSGNQVAVHGGPVSRACSCGPKVLRCFRPSA